MAENLQQDPWPRWLSARKAAEYTSRLIGEKRIIQMIQAGTLRGGRDKGRKDSPWFVDKESIDDYFQRQSDEVQAAVDDVLIRAGLKKRG